MRRRGLENVPFRGELRQSDLEIRLLVLVSLNNVEWFLLFGYPNRL